MALAQFKNTTDSHNNLSELIRSVTEEGVMVFITHHGQPKYVLMPLKELAEGSTPEQIIGVRALAKGFHQYLKQLDEWGELYITHRNKPVAQLLSIEPNDVDDMIVIASRHLQEDAELYSSPKAVESLTSGTSLLNELKAIRSKAQS